MSHGPRGCISALIQLSVTYLVENNPDRVDLRFSVWIQLDELQAGEIDARDLSVDGTSVPSVDHLILIKVRLTSIANAILCEENYMSVFGSLQDEVNSSMNAPWSFRVTRTICTSSRTERDLLY